MVSTPCGKKILYSKRNTECNYFPSYCDLNLFQKTFNHLSQTKTAATIKKLKRKIMN